MPSHLIALRFFINIFLILLSININAQIPVVNNQNLIFKNYTYENSSIATNTIYKMLIGTDGFLWLATEKGLVKYDGKVFDLIDLGKKQDVIELYQRDLDNAIAYCYNGDVYNINQKTHKVYQLHLEQYADKKYHTAPFFWYFRSDNKEYLINHVSHVLLNYNKSANLLLRSGNPEKNIPAEDLMNFLLQYYKPKNSKDELIDSTIHWIKSNKSLFWDEHIVILNQHVYNRSSKELYFSPKQNYGLPKNTSITYILKNEKDLWIGTIEDGLYVIENYKDSKKRKKRKILPNFITQILKDKSDNIWVSTYQNGLFLFKKKDYNTLLYNNGNTELYGENILRLIYEPRLNLLGLVFERDHNVFYTCKKIIKDLFVSKFDLRNSSPTFIQDEEKWLLQSGNKYISGNFSDSILKNSGRFPLEKKFPAHIFYATKWKDAVTFKGNFYLNLQYIVYSIRNGLIDSQNTFTNTISIQPISDSTILMGTVNGIYINHRKLCWLPETIFYKIRTFDSILYCCTNEGIFKININQIENRKSLIKISDLIAFDVKKQKSNIFFRTNDGIAFVSINQKNRIKEISFKEYTIPFKINDFAIDSNKIIVAGSKGLFVFQSTDLLSSTSPPPIVISNNYSKINVTDTFLSTHYQSNFSILLNLNILDFDDNKKHVRYTVYKDQKVYIDTKVCKENYYQIQLNKLEPGKYLIKYEITSPLFWWHDIKEFKLEILPLWWQMKSSRIIFIILLISIIIWLVSRIIISSEKQKFKKIVQKNQILSLQNRLHLSRLKPHFIFNALTPLHNLILQDKKQESLIYFERFSKLMRSSISQFNIEYNSIKEECKFLELYLHVQQQRFPSLFTFNISTGNIRYLNYIKIPSMLLQPLIENAIEHGVIKNGEIKNKINAIFSIEENKLIVNVCNTGNPIPQDHIPNPNRGLGILYERISIIKMEMGIGEIEYKYEHNTSIFTLNLPLIIKYNDE